MYTLCINDTSGQTQKWWMNFLLSLPYDVKDIPKELKKWGARVDYDKHGYSDIVTFDKEEDLTWFVLRWG